MIYHVAKTGSDYNVGSEQAPFLTIQQAANAAQPGDEVVIHEGTYREWVDPKCGGINEGLRITYRAADGERPVIKGSEAVTGWTLVKGKVWRASVPNTIFGSFNPFAQKLWGDWLVDPKQWDVHLGCVYLDGTALYEARSEEELYDPPLRTVSELETWGGRTEPVLRSEESLRVWSAEVLPEETIVYANFGGADPNAALVEINVRPCCFYPTRNNVNYIIVRGLELCHAATQWAPPSGNQVGLIGPNWAKGWVIEENIIHDSKCSGISLGKDASTGDSAYSHCIKKPDYLYQMEAVFRALTKGWSKEQVGSHMVRNNTIYDCGQTGIVGHMGCVFSQIYGNDISYIATRHEFFGHELGGIKLHAAIDVQISRNHIHHCTLGTWLDWQAQGARVSCNVYDHNARDLFIEVCHGPHLVEHNVLASAYSLDIASEGGAFAHNLFGGIINLCSWPDRPTPYHLPHSTQVLGVIWNAGRDDRWYQNIFAGGGEGGAFYGTDGNGDASQTMEEYYDRLRDFPQDYLLAYRETPQPVYIHRNVYLRDAKAWEHEKDAILYPGCNADLRVEYTADGPELCLTLPEDLPHQDTCRITTALLGSPRNAEACFETPEGTPLTLDHDLVGELLSESPIAGPLQGLHAGENRIPLGLGRIEGIETNKCNDYLTRQIFCPTIAPIEAVWYNIAIYLL